MTMRWDSLVEVRPGRWVPRLVCFLAASRASAPSEDTAYRGRTSRGTRLIGFSIPRWLTACALVIALLAIATGCGTRSDSHKNAALETMDVAISGRTFRLELATDDATRFQGLSDREDIPADGGMLFVFPDARERNFVMRRCPNPIDILFLSETGRIVKTHAMKPDPPGTREDNLASYPSGWPAAAAIELRGGTIVTLGIAEGQKIDLPMEALKKRAR